ncbi:phosphoenolpyruvate--protein phosphotransferase [Paenibacillus glycanilyticus]|uniref:phosphoenolpyruvate--protein phosphotransferase n=1 Tax=Paenibacillus glycanilyticus TaxID=126569 RepID=UPI002040A97A|nr:phosphoenolpyruvate--protein phosphotransferase [Paenibacillus glycanilyticus]MCM3627075.1 phosphoenolpyruvate--protein phosphotransferase [Paenibacillus glycanilyticus]
MMATEIKGIAASEGYAIGRAVILREDAVPEGITYVESGDEAAELNRFDSAVAAARVELEALLERMKSDGREKEAEIFEAHLMLLEDEELIGAAQERIRGQRYKAESAMNESGEEVAEMLASLDDEYLRERAADVRDVSRRVIRKLGNASDSEAAKAPVANKNEKSILFAFDLTPSDTAQLDPSVIGGFVTAAGGRTSHSAIIARSVGIPAIVGAGEGALHIEEGQLVIVDGAAGLVLIEPEDKELAHYQALQEQAAGKRALLDQYRGKPSISADGHQVELVANIGSVQDARQAREHGAEGVGLFRTEFLYMGRPDLPTEEEQFTAYKEAAEAFGPDAPIVIRTMDIGGDKELPGLQLEKEDNPFLGYRAIRICLDRPDLFKTQLRAVLRASAFGNLKIMYPMIAALAEWRAAKALLEEAKQELRSENIAFNEQIEAGIMIEIPAAAQMADRFAREVDFFSIGTNDLVQYTMAADRMNPKLGYLSDPLHPPVLRLIDQVIRAAHQENKWVGMCGEMAGTPVALPILLGMGLDEFSMSASAVLPARALLSRLDRSKLASLAEAVLDLDDAEEVRSYVEQHVPELNR